MDAYSQDPWTEAQWTQVQETVRDEAKKQRVAASFLPLYGPLPEDAQTVPKQVLEPRPPATNGEFLEVDDFDTQRLTSLSVRVALRSAQVSQEDLSSALLAFRRAANLIARAEDHFVFNGQLQTDPDPPPNLDFCAATGGQAFDGLVKAAEKTPTHLIPAGPGISGEDLVSLVEQATGRLEIEGHVGPFALILNTRLFSLAHNPVPGSLVLPADRIKPLLDGPLLRSSTLNLGAGRAAPFRGILVSLGGDPIDLVVGSEICVRLIQVTAEASPRHVYRVSERFTLRIKQPTAIARLG